MENNSIKDFDIKTLTSFKIGGKINEVFFPENIQNFEQILLTNNNIKVFGNLSNTLISSDGYNGKIILTSKMNSITIDGTKVIADCGVKGPKLALEVAEKGLSGLEFMIGFPGSIGGEVFMNASANNQAISDNITKVTCFCPNEGIKTFSKDEMPHFSLEETIQGKGMLTFTGMEDEVGTSGSSVFDLSMEINDVLAQNLQQAGFTVHSNKVVYGSPLYDPQLSLSKYGYETMLYLPGADADILGKTQSNLIKQGYLWAISGTDDDGKLSDEERVAYNKYREAVLAAWDESDDFMITLTVTQYDSKENMIVLRQYHTQMDFVAEELLPELTVASVALDQSNLDF